MLAFFELTSGLGLASQRSFLRKTNNIVKHAMNVIETNIVECNQLLYL